MKYSTKPRFLAAAAVLIVWCLPPSQVEIQAQKYRSNRFPRMTIADLKSRIEKNDPVYIIDVRSKKSYDESDKKIKGSVRISVLDLESRVYELPHDKVIVLYCACPNEQTSGRGALVLMDRGFTNVYALKGGWDAWVAAGAPVEAKDSGTPAASKEPQSN